MRWKSCSKTMLVLANLAVAMTLAPGVWAAPKYSVLYNFQGGRNGMSPQGALISDAAGNLYGVTAGGGEGGNGGCGTVFELRRVKDRWAEKELYVFPGNAKDGCGPNANLAFDTKGNLYGVTVTGGKGDCSGHMCGTVFELTPSAGDKWKETVLYRFAGGNDGAAPNSGVIFDATGNLYGTTEVGGGTSCGCGTVFELTPKAGGGWNETILHSFSGTDGGEPCGLVFDGEGNLYGVGQLGWV
jgi:uncharacterized repeat protein (TIGR03803 family)